jgi:hypothetical protein
MTVTFPWMRRSLSLFVPVAVLLLLLASLWIIYQGERSYRTEQQHAAQVQAEILAASATAALDFEDRATAQESANASARRTVPRFRRSYR